MTEPTIKDVSDTAYWIAHLRAAESDRPDALFRDPLAHRLAGMHGRELASSMPVPGMFAWSVAIRTRIVDEYIRSAIDSGVDTILNLGAGLDTRPYRMDLPPSLSWIEADYGTLMDYKQRELGEEMSCCRLERVKIDLADLPARRELLARVDSQAQKLLVLTEGVIPYLSVEQTASLAGDLRAMRHAACWIVDYFSREAMKFRSHTGMNQKMKNAPFRFDPDDWFGFFRAHGWRPDTMKYLADEGERLQRPLPVPFLVKAAMKITMPFAPRAQRDAMRKFAGYALLVPC